MVVISKAVAVQAIPKIDLFYILPNILVGSFPANFKIFPCSHRSDLHKILSYLEISFTHSLVLNLAIEPPEYTVSSKYKGKIFCKRVNWFDYRPFPVYELITLMHCVINFLKKKGTGVFIHCEHGKGRSGTLVCALLMVMFDLNIKEANSMFAKRRFLFPLGVDIKQQIRFLEYLNFLLLGDNFKDYVKLRDSYTWKIKSVEIHASPEVKKGVSFRISAANLTTLKFHVLGTVQVGDKCENFYKFNEDICFKVESSKIINKMFTTFSINSVVEALYGDNHKKKLFAVVVPFKNTDGINGTAIKGENLFDRIVITLKKSTNGFE